MSIRQLVAEKFGQEAQILVSLASGVPLLLKKVVKADGTQVVTASLNVGGVWFSGVLFDADKAVAVATKTGGTSQVFKRGTLTEDTSAEQPTPAPTKENGTASSPVPATDSGNPF